MKDVQVYSVIKAHPDKETHLTNTGVTSSSVNEMSHIMNKKIDPVIKKGINHHHHLKAQLTPKNQKHQCSSLGIA